MAMYAAAVDISRLFQEEPKCSCSWIEAKTMIMGRDGAG